jgi:hypothetical protein
LRSGRASLVAKQGPSYDFPQSIFGFHYTPFGNRNVGRGLGALAESGVKVAENSPPQENASEISIKTITIFLLDNFTLLKPKIQLFFQESAAEMTHFYLQITNFQNFSFS